MTRYQIAVLPGDGIGPEVMPEALKVLRAVEQHAGVRFEVQEAPFGAQAYFDHGHPFPDLTKAICDGADAILKGPIGLGHAATQQIPVDLRPERGAALPIRARYQTYANFRPIVLPAVLARFSPLRPEIIGAGLDIMLIRELLGGVYFGPKTVGRDADNHRYVEEVLRYDEVQIRQVLRKALDLARRRKGVLHHIHKSNVLKSSVLWNEVLEELAPAYADVQIVYMLADAAATHLCLNPRQFDVMVMENLFGDILSDQGGGLIGSLGLMPSACLGDGKAYYEPAHGSAPDIAGRGIANPYSMIGSVAMMLEHSFGMTHHARAIWTAMHGVYASGACTPDLAAAAGASAIIGTAEFGDRVVEQLHTALPAPACAP